MNISVKNIFQLLTIAFLVIGQVSFAQKKKKTEEKSAFQLQESEALFTDGMKFFMMEDYEKAIAPYEKALEITPDNAGILFSLSNTYLRLKNEDKAVEYAEKAVKQDGENLDYQELLADIYMRKKDFVAAAKVYQSLTQKAPTNPSYFLEQSAIHIFNNKYEDAIKSYNQAEKILGVSEEITRQKQMVLIKQGKVEDAIREGEKLIESDPEEVDFKVDQAELLMTNRRSEKAIPYLEQILKLSPENAQAHVMLAQLYQEKGDYEKCNKELELAFADNGLDANTKSRILMSYIEMLKDDKSKETAFNLVKNLLKTNPKDPKAHAIYGDLLIKKGETSLGRDAYVRAARLDKSISAVWGQIIQFDFDLKQLDSAIKHSEEAIEVFPNQSLFWYLNGSAYYQKRKNDKAIESLEEARRLAPDGSELTQHIYAQLGDTYNSLSKHEKSDDAYESALKENPNNDHVLNNYSYFLSLRKEKLERALEMSGKLVERNPDNGTYLDTHAWVLYVKKDYQKARQFLEKAVINNKSKSGTVIEHYGDVLFQLGEKDKAVEQWKRAKSTGGSSTSIDQKIADQKLAE
jgi:tetratricopeptide (TPR) repeat protein